MTQIEKLLKRIETMEPGLQEITVYVTKDRQIGFWIVQQKDVKIEGENDISYAKKEVDKPKI